MKQFYLLMFAAAITLVGCSKNDEADSIPQELTIEQTDYMLGAIDNRSATISFTASADWTLTVIDANADWLTVTPASGTTGSQTVELTARRNFGETERTVCIEITCGKQQTPVTVTQNITETTDFTDWFDPVFADALQKEGHISNAGKISRQDMEHLAEVTRLEVVDNYMAPLTSLKGIEYFESLRKLHCYDTSLTELVITDNTSLIELDCSSGPITSLDVSGCTALKTLYYYNSDLASLNIEGCTSLEGIIGYRAQLTSLDLSGCPALQFLNCEENQLTSLNLSGCTALTQIECSDNQLTTLDLSGCESLTGLICIMNPLKTLNLSGCRSLMGVVCMRNELTSLDLSGCSALRSLSCEDNKLTSLDLNDCTSLTEVDCTNNQLTGLDISPCTKLQALWCDDNPGDGISTFPITAWFDNTSIPTDFMIQLTEWTYEDKEITVEFRKAE